MKFIFIFLLSFGLVFGGEYKTYSLKIKSSQGSFSEKMVIEKTEKGYSVKYLDKKGEGSVNKFDGNFKPVETVYFDIAGKNYIEIKFDSEKHKIISSGDIEKTYKLEEPVYDGNGAMFFIFSRILPEPGKNFTFNMLQSKDKRIVEMSFRYSAKETVKSEAGERVCLKYEMKVSSRFLSFFWPYKYYYWFDETTKEFVRYEGPFGHENNEVIEAVN